MTALDDLRFWAQTFEDSRRTILCPPGLGDKVRALAEQHGVGGMFDVQESSACPEDQILMVDHNALDASTRQALQRMAKGPLWVDRKHAHGMDCCRGCFEGLHVHPLADGDPTCKDRGDEHGHCIYAKEIS